MAPNAAAERSGHARAYPMGRHMVGIDSWAMVDPSVYVTMEWTIDWGCTTTSMSSKPMPTPCSPAGSPNSSLASITSRPLFISVEESTVIFGPMLHVGWARASSTVTSARSALVRPRNGPPLAVRTSLATRGGPASSRDRRHWWRAPCSLSTGTSSAPGVRRARCTTGPPAMRDSLLASARRLPASNVASVTRRPANPTTPLTHTSASAPRLAKPSVPPRTSTPPRRARASSTRASSAMATTRGRTAATCSASTSRFRPVAPRATIS